MLRKIKSCFIDLFRRKNAGMHAGIDKIKSMRGNLHVSKVDDGVDYFGDFLDLIDIPQVHMETVEETLGSRWCLRHDVDHNIDVAMAVARAEYQRGYKSTYFLLTPNSYAYGSNYYGHMENKRIMHAPDLIDKCKYIQDFGHRIGFHNDLISLSLLLKIPPEDILEREIEYFTKNDIRLWGTAAHGNPLARKLEYNNREIFKGCIRQGREVERIIKHDGWEIETHTLNLEDYGFLYEAYSLPRDSRISESGRKWGGKVAGEQIDRDSLANRFDIDKFRKYIKRLSVSNGVDSLQVMTHPEHWQVLDENKIMVKR